VFAGMGEKKKESLDWKTRLQIALNSARGKYEECSSPLDFVVNLISCESILRPPAMPMQVTYSSGFLCLMNQLQLPYI
jgi:hypothetical protein